MTSARKVVGLDVGGANLKAAVAEGAAWSRPFALWRDPGGLADALRGLLAHVPPADLLAVTMTGELCDCFDSKRAGVHAILDAVEAVARGPVVVWRNDGRFSDPAAARADYLRTASANWLALAAFAGRWAPQGPALLIDVGSTTTDLIPLCDGQPAPRGRTDPERLRSGELVYTGVRRTPLCALLGPGAAAELFATSGDAYLALGDVDEDAADHVTADGQPATRAAAHRRLARMLCGDLETTTEPERRALAAAAAEQQIDRIAGALRAVVPGASNSPLRVVVLAGEGEFLARRALDRVGAADAATRISLAERLGPATSIAAAAYAVAMLAMERAGEICR